MFNLRPTCAALLLSLAITLPLHAQNNKTQIEQIVQVISHTYDQANNKVQTAPVVVQGDYAIASWRQGEKGGRALLKRQSGQTGQWEILLCAGSGLRQEAGLIAAGIAPALAKQLAAQLKQAEQSLPAEQIARFDSFDSKLTPHHASSSAKHH